MKPGDLYWSLVEFIWDSVSIYDGPEAFLAQFNTAPLGARTLFAAHWCQSEIRNGGLHQFFGNSTGVLAPEAVAAFRSIGMPKVAAIVAEAMLWFGPNYPRNREVRDGQLGDYENDDPEDWNPFDQLDDQFFALIESENGGFVRAADEFALGHHR